MNLSLACSLMLAAVLCHRQGTLCHTAWLLLMLMILPVEDPSSESFQGSQNASATWLAPFLTLPHTVILLRHAVGCSLACSSELSVQSMSSAAAKAQAGRPKTASSCSLSYTCLCALPLSTIPV